MEEIKYKVFESPVVLSARGGAIKANWKKAVAKAIEKSDNREKAEELTEKALMSAINMLSVDQQIALLEDNDRFNVVLNEAADAIDWSGILKSILTTALNVVATTLINIIIGKLFQKPLDK